MDTIAERTLLGQSLKGVVLSSCWWEMGFVLSLWRELVIIQTYGPRHAVAANTQKPLHHSGGHVIIISVPKIVYK